MADENKTYDATPKKIKDSRKEGNVPRSQEFGGMVILFFGTLALFVISPYITDALVKILSHSCDFITLTNPKEMSSEGIKAIFQKFALEIAFPLIGFLFFIVIIAILSNLLQFGFLFTPLKISFKKMNPIEGFKNLFHWKKFVDFIKMFLKLIIVFIILGSVIYMFGPQLINSIIYNPESTVDLIIQVLMYLLGFIMLNIIIFSIVDLVFVRYNYFKKLKMSFQEIKDEFKQTEGNPEIKARIREIQKKMASGNMLNDVKDSKFIVTNPTHYAVAIKYDENNTTLPPVIVAKGIDFLAQKIRTIGTDNDIPIIENPPLARALYSAIEVGQPISEDFYQNVVDLLIYVEKLNSKK